MSVMCLPAADSAKMAAIEKEQGIEVDPELAAFMRANQLEGKRENVQTEFILHMLGLNVCADTLVSGLAGCRTGCDFAVCSSW